MNRLVSVLLLLCTAGLTAAAQQVAASTVAIQRDPKAVLMLKKSLGALGGANSWSQIRCAVIDGTATFSNANDSSPIRIKHCWNNLSLQSRHEFVYGKSKVIRYADPVKGASISTDGKIQDLTAKARVADLPDKLPAVAFLIALGKMEYSITFVTPTRQEPHIGIKLLHFDQGVPEPASEQDWYFSETTSLPDYVVTYLRDSANKSRLLRSKKSFVGFVNDGSVKVPSGLEETLISGGVRKITFQSVILNPSQSSSDFDPSHAEGPQ